MDEQEYIRQLEFEKKELQDQLTQVSERRTKKKKFRSWLLKKSSIPIFGIPLKKSISNAINEYKERKTVSVDTVSDVSSKVIWRITRIGLFAFLVAVVPTLFLAFQTKLLLNQNSLIKTQNISVEATRRSSLVFVMSDVLSDLNQELRVRGSGSGERNISRTLEARIVSLCMAMKPYRYTENGELIENLISPERGQLLFTLLKSNLGPESSQDILNAADFHFTNLENINLGRGVRLKYARLDHSNISNVQMPAANLERAELKESNLSNTNLSDAILIRANLTRANMEKAELLSANFTNANLFGANLSNADLSEATLWGTKLDNADITDVTLDNAIVHRQDWIAYVTDSLDLKGAGTIEDRYRIKKQGKEQFIIVPRK